LETGFVVAQLALQEESRRPTRTALYVNTAPRQDRRDPRRNNEGVQLVYVKLRNGVEIGVVNSGYSLSFVREEITELRTVLIDLGGSQFRSRDNFPEVIGRMVRQDDFEKILGDELSPSGVIPHFEPDVIAYRDSFGNLKTGLRSSNERLKRL